MMSSLYIAATGMQAQSKGLQVVSDNLANTSTIAYKQRSIVFENMVNQTINTQSNFTTNVSQRGSGAAVADIRTNFEVGAFEHSNTVTDLAINGNGYFGVVKNGQTCYTRAGNFRFDAEGYLRDANGNALLARPIVNGVASTAVQEVKLDTGEGSKLLTSVFNPTSYVKMTSNLGGTQDYSTSDSNPFFALAGSWDGTSSPPLGAGEYGYSEPITVYDSNGDAHTLKVYYDYAGMENGNKVYEYVVGVNPSEDGSANAGTAAAGLLMAGTMTFSGSGALVGMTGFTPTGQDPADLSAWTQAGLTDGVPSFTANFAGSGAQSISLDFGLNLSGGWSANIDSPLIGTSDPSLFYAKTNGAIKEAESSTSYGSSPVSRQQTQDGYPQGDLYDIYITDEGVITGSYTNGESRELYQITLYRFVNEGGLRSEGSNLYSATTASGAADEGLPTDENFGSVEANHIEQSNVDTAREFTQMIISQRGFQMNSKVITTSDTMLQKALELKR